MTTIPSNTACLAVPREPTRYAATMVFAVSGFQRVNAPRPAATSAAEIKTQKLNLFWVEMSSVKRLRGVFCARTPGAAELSLGRQRHDADGSVSF